MKAILISVMLAGSFIAGAQTPNEWFQQKETQKKYLLQQIAALKMFIDYAEKGYNIANKGSQTIHSIKKGDFNLHNDFFNSLKQINPAIKNWSRIEDIIEMQIKIIKQIKDVHSSITKQAQLTTEEIDYCYTVFDKLANDCLEDIDELMLATTPGELQMKDDERMEKIEKIFIGMEDKYAFVNSFSNELKILLYQRAGEQKEAEVLKALYK